MNGRIAVPRSPRGVQTRADAAANRARFGFGEPEIVGISGGAGGLGAAMARGFVEAGVSVVLFDLPQAERRARALVQELVEVGGVDVKFVPVDVTDEHAVGAAFDASTAEMGDLSAWINNAGTAIRTPSLDVSLGDWNRQIELNLTASFVCAQQFARRARAAVERGALARASIINVASVFGLVGGINRAAYSATKGALVNLTRTLALEWYGYGIRVNAVAPTFVETDLTRPLKVNGLDVLNRSLGETWAQPADVAHAVRFLASHYARGIVGHTLPVDYGWTSW